LIGTNLLLRLRLWLKALLLRGLWLKERLQVLLNLLNIWASSSLHLLLLRNRVRSLRYRRRNLIVTHRSCCNLVCTHRNCRNLVVTHRRYLLLLIFHHRLTSHLCLRILLLLLLKWINSILSSTICSRILWLHEVVRLTFVSS